MRKGDCLKFVKFLRERGVYAPLTGRMGDAIYTAVKTQARWKDDDVLAIVEHGKGGEWLQRKAEVIMKRRNGSRIVSKVASRAPTPRHVSRAISPATTLGLRASANLLQQKQQQQHAQPHEQWRAPGVTNNLLPRFLPQDTAIQSIEETENMPATNDLCSEGRFFQETPFAHGGARPTTTAMPQPALYGERERLAPENVPVSQADQGEGDFNTRNTKVAISYIFQPRREATNAPIYAPAPAQRSASNFYRNDNAYIAPSRSNNASNSRSMLPLLLPS